MKSTFWNLFLNIFLTQANLILGARPITSQDSFLSKLTVKSLIIKGSISRLDASRVRKGL